MIPDGIHYGLSEREYRADPAYSYSRVKLGIGTMAEYKQAVDNPSEPTDAMITGTLIDQIVFNGALEGVDIKPEPRAPSGWRESVIAAGKIPASKHMVETASMCASSLSRHSVARGFLQSPGCSQVSMFLTWNGIRLKARIDRVPAKSTALVDLKKCQDASPGRYVTRDDGTEYFQKPKWAYDLREYCYHMQAGLYLWMWNQLAGSEDPRTDWVHVCVEEKAPHLVNVFQMGAESIAAGEKLFFDTLARIRECEASGKWPGYKEEVTVVEVAR